MQLRASGQFAELRSRTAPTARLGLFRPKENCHFVGDDWLG
jgi:hypothetical protein